MAAERRIRILIVDDSAVMRSLLRSVVSAEPGLDVAGTAADGASALSSIGLLRPDLILLDVEMPVMDGLVTLRELRRRGHKMPVIMCSSVTQRGAKVTLEALASGASDYVAKPAGQANREAAIKALGKDLGPKILALTHQLQPQQSSIFAHPASHLAVVHAGRPAFQNPGHPVSSHCAGHRRLHRWPGRSRIALARAAGKLPSARACGAAHAGVVYQALCRAAR
jgi:two-component system chemotaxis response regulator CheB